MKHVRIARIAADARMLADAIVPGYSFPFPKTGAEFIYHSKMRYRDIS